MKTYFRVLHKGGAYYPQLLQTGFFKNKWVYLSLYAGTKEPYPHSTHDLAVEVVTHEIACSLSLNLEEATK